MHQSGYLSVLDAKTPDELLGELVCFTRQIGFEIVSAMAVIDHFLAEPEFIGVGNVPDGYLATFQDLECGKVDPVMQHCKAGSRPIAWDQSTYIKAGKGDKWEHQAHHGYKSGIALAMHMPKGLHFMIGIERDSVLLPAGSAETVRAMADLQLFAVHAQEAAMRVLVPGAAGEQEDPRLTRRELECLRWTMEGKTAWELGRILGIAEQTVVRHTFNATQKLGCVNKHHAVVKALRLGLVC